MRPLKGRKYLENIYMNLASLPLQEKEKRSMRRIFHTLERRYLSPEAQGVIYSLLDAQSVSPDITENAIQQAVILGSMSGTVIDAPTFEAVLEAVTLNPAFSIPFTATFALTPSNSWVC